MTFGFVDRGGSSVGLVWTQDLALSRRLAFVWVRLVPVPSVALLLPTALPSRISFGRRH